MSTSSWQINWRSLRQVSDSGAVVFDVVNTSDDESEADSDVEEVTHFEVKRIVTHRVGSDGAQEYFVEWSGYSWDECTWEPASSFESCPEVLRQYHTQLAEDYAAAVLKSE